MGARVPATHLTTRHCSRRVAATVARTTFSAQLDGELEERLGEGTNRKDAKDAKIRDEFFGLAMHDDVRRCTDVLVRHEQPNLPLQIFVTFASLRFVPLPNVRHAECRA